MDKHLVVKKTHLDKWSLLGRIDHSTLKLVKLFKPHGNRLWAALSDGRFIAAGDNWNGLLGVGHDKTVNTFEELTALRGKSVCKIVAGWTHVMVLTEEGQLWGWRWTEDKHKTRRNKIIPQLIMQRGVVDVKCGMEHSLALLEGGKVVGMGDNQNFQLGIGNTNNQDRPVPLMHLAGEEIKVIETGPYHSMVVTTKGRVYGWGCNRYYQLAIGNNDDQCLPVKVDVNAKIVDSIACTRGNSIFLTRDKLCYIAGWNKQTLRRVELPGQAQQIFAIDYSYHSSRSYGKLFVASTSTKLIFWGETSHGAKPSPLQTEFCLSEIIFQYSEHQSCPTTLYIEQANDVKQQTSDQCPMSQQTLNSLFSSPTFADIEFLLPGNESIKAHRCILSASSAFMCRQLSTEWKNQSRIRLLHPQPIFRLYLSHLYSVSLHPNLPLDQISQLIALSYTFDQQSLSQSCALHLSSRLTTKNVCRIYEIAYDYHLDQLKDQAFVFIQSNFDRIKLTQGFKQMKPEASKDYLSKL